MPPQLPPGFVVDAPEPSTTPPRRNALPPGFEVDKPYTGPLSRAPATRRPDAFEQSLEDLGPTIGDVLAGDAASGPWRQSVLQNSVDAFRLERKMPRRPMTDAPGDEATLGEQLFAGFDEWRANRELDDALDTVGQMQTIEQLRTGGGRLEQLRIGRARAAEAGLTERVAEFDEQIARIEESHADPARTGRFDAARQGLLAALERQTGDIERLQAQAGTIEFSPDTQAMLEAGTLGEGVGAFFDDPLGIVAELGVRSLPNMTEGVALALLGSLAGGPAGMAVGMGAGSGLAEYRASMGEFLMAAGVDVSDPRALLAAAENTSLMQAAAEHSLTRAGIIGAVDVATGGIATRTLSPFKQPLAREATNLVAQAGVQAAGGAGGEAAAQLATEGEIAIGEVLGEAVGEFITAPIDVATATAAGVRRVPRATAAPGAVAPEDEISPIGSTVAAGDLPFQVEPEYTAAEFEAETQRAPANAERDSLLEYLSKSRAARAAMGGISTEEAIAQGIDPASIRSAAGAGILRPFTRGGMSFDNAAELLAEAGFPVTDAEGRYDPNILLDLIDRELRGEKVYSIRNQGALEQEYEEQARAYYGDQVGEVEAGKLPPGFVVDKPIGETIEGSDETIGLEDETPAPAEGTRTPTSRRDLELAVEDPTVRVLRRDAMESDDFTEISNVTELGDEPVDNFEIVPRGDQVETSQETGVFRTMSERAAAAPRDRGLEDRVASEFLRTDSIERGQRDAKKRGLEDAVRSLLGGTKKAPAVEFILDEDGLDPDLKSRMQRTPGLTTKGSYDPKTNRVILFTDAIKDPADAAFTAAHEIAGHLGLLGALGRDVDRGRARQRLNNVLALVQQNTTVRELAQTIQGKRTTLTNLQALEEALAELAAATRTGDYARIEQRYGLAVPEAMRDTLKGAIARLIQRIKALLKSATGFTYTDAQVRELLEGAWRYVRTGEADMKQQRAGSDRPADVDDTARAQEDDAHLTTTREADLEGAIEKLQNRIKRMRPGDPERTELEEILSPMLEEMGRRQREVDVTRLAEDDAGADRRAAPRDADRRVDEGQRKRVDQMTAEELRRELLTHELTGIPNRRAYDEASKLPVQASIDVDSLKWVNDNMTHGSGDELLKAVARVLADEFGEQAYHISGDEFVVQAQDQGRARALMSLVQHRLGGATIEAETAAGETVTLRGIGVSYGLGGTLDEAEGALQRSKERREARGERAARGEAPAGVETARRRDDQARDAAREEDQVLLSEDDDVSPALRRWFGDSVVTDTGQPGGKPKKVYRGEHGADTSGDVQTRSPSITFGDREGANLYATQPNNRKADPEALAPRVTPVYLRIENPIVNTPDDPFIDFSTLIAAIGEEQAREIALRHADSIVNTGNWEENFQADFDSVEDVVRFAPERLGELYVLAFKVLDDPEAVQALRAAGYDGAVTAGFGDNHDESEYRVFERRQIKSAIGNRGTFEPAVDDITLSEEEQETAYEDPALERIRDEVDEIEQQLGPAAKSGFTGGPGKRYVGLYQSSKPMPLKPQGVSLRTGTVEPPATPTTIVRREHVMELFQRLFDLKIYEGKPFKIRSALGFFRPRNYELRIKAKSDLEVAAHEVFHWIDRTYPTLRKLYHRKKFRDELKGVSYDVNLIFEGFAEFGRLYMTQEPEAVTRTPMFYEAFVEEARKLGILDKLDRVQRLMHAWYNQGAENRAMSKIGNLPAPIPQRLGAHLELWQDKAIARSLDWLHVVKMVEAKLRGSVQDDAAWSPYKSMRLLAGVKSSINAWLNYGTLGWTAEGDLKFTGKGLKQIFEPVADVFDETMAYFVGRRANELRQHGKENLFTPDEIKALLDRGRNSPKREQIEQAFRDYQEYTSRLLDFAQQSGILSPATRAMWEQLYENYVPFYRVADRMGKTMDQMPTGQGQVFKRLFGGTANLRDTFDNITQNTAAVVTAAMRNIAKRQLFGMLDSSPLGQRYAVRIPTDTEVVTFSAEQLEQVLRQLVKEANEKAARASEEGLDASAAEIAQIQMLAAMLANRGPLMGSMPIKEVKAQFQLFFSGRPPSIPDKDMVLIDGKPVYFQIGDPMLWDMLTELNYARPLTLAERALGFASRLKRRTVTLEPTFQLRNMFRDILNAFTMSKGKQIPFVHAIAALKDVWTESENLKLFLANGGGYGLMVGEEARRLRTRLKRYRHGWQWMPDLQAFMDAWDKWGWSFELATRLAEFKRIRQQGKSLREAAFQGREISTDFAMHGNAAIVQLTKLGTAFWNARIQGLYRIERELFERKGRTAAMGERFVHYTLRALIGLTFPALIAYWIMRGRPEYEDLPEDIKSLYTVLPGPDGDVILLPRPFETGALFQEVPVRMLERFLGDEDEKFGDAMMFMLMETFSLDPTFTALAPIRDVFWRNRTWNGFPVVPRGLEDVTPAEQYQPWTTETMKRVGELFGVSPLKLEALWSGYLSQLGMYALEATDALITLDEDAEDPKTTLSSWPVIRGFFREQPYRNTAQEQHVYELLDEIAEVVATARKIRNEGRGDDLEAWLSEPEREVLAGLEGVANNVREATSTIRGARQAIYNDAELDADEKRAELDALQEQENQLFRDVEAALSDEQLEQLRRALGGLE